MTKFKQKIKYKILLIALLIIASFAAMLYMLVSFSQNIKVRQAQIGIEELKSVTLRNVYRVQNSVQDKINFVQAVADEMATLDDLKSEKANYWIEKFATGTSFERLAIDFANEGVSITSDGYVVNIADMGYVDQIYEGKAFVTELLNAKIDGKPTVSIIVPIVKDGKSDTAIRGTISTQKFGKLLETDYFGGEGYFHLMDANGNYLAMPSSSKALLMDENYFDAIKKLSFDKGYSMDKIISDMRAGVSGNTAYEYNGEGRYAEYMSVGINDWILMIVTPKEVIDANAEMIQTEVIALIIKLSLVAIVVVGIILYATESSRDAVKKMNEELLVSEKRYLFMLNSNHNTVFEYTLATGVMEYNCGFVELFGFEPRLNNFPQSIIQSNYVLPEDKDIMLKLFSDMRKGVQDCKVELRLLNKNNTYIWCSISASAILDESGKTIKAMGIVEDISEQKSKEEMLILKAERDQLTYLYNKSTTEQLIKGFLTGKIMDETKHALMIIDVDDFKSVNDTFGHMYGDTVLQKLAGILQPVFRDSDIVGRLGGDEFFVFMKNVFSEETAKAKAQEVCDAFRQTYSENGESCTVSASIGIALYPEDGVDFESLYKHADTALYLKKSTGKDGYCVYDGNDAYNYQSLRSEISQERT
ncbi:MAG: diguanylate cyclase [Oscillospiraceae bacterium]